MKGNARNVDMYTDQYKLNDDGGLYSSTDKFSIAVTRFANAVGVNKGY